MIDNQLDTTNPKFTPEQTQAIEESKSRLLNLETEISIASKNLKAIKGESERAMRDKTYQEGLLTSVTDQTTTAQEKLSAITTSTEKAQESLSAINQEISKQGDILASKKSEFKEREEEISSKETDLISRETSVSLREEDLKNSEEELQDKYAKIKDFAANI